MARKARARRGGTPSRAVLAVDSNYEPVTKAAFDYRETHVYPYLTQKGLILRKFQGPLARRHYLVPEARKTDVAYITGVGHGLYDTYTGDWGNTIFQVGNYHPDESRGKVVHLLSCQTARTLGPDFVANGTRAYFGYDENFTFVMAHRDVFFECDSEIDRAFADGLTAARVYDRVIALFDRRINEAIEAGQQYIAATLQFDRDHLRAPSSGSQWGDQTAAIRGSTRIRGAARGKPVDDWKL